MKDISPFAEWCLAVMDKAGSKYPKLPTDYNRLGVTPPVTLPVVPVTKTVTEYRP